MIVDGVGSIEQTINWFAVIRSISIQVIVEEFQNPTATISTWRDSVATEMT